MSSLAPADMRRLKSTFALFGSDKNGEVIAAISAAKRLLTKAGLGFGNLTIEQALPSLRPEPAPNAWQPRQAPPRAEVLRPHHRQASMLLLSVTPGRNRRVSSSPAWSAGIGQ